jgi:hypothetical protein
VLAVDWVERGKRNERVKAAGGWNGIDQGKVEVHFSSNKWPKTRLPAIKPIGVVAS